jgi:GNAT superfamily N-acetyltransferase
MTERPRIRPAQPDDVAAVARLSRAVRQACLPYLPDLHTPEEDLWFFRNRVFPACDVWVAGSDALVGFCAHRPGWIEHLYVDPAHQGLGLGCDFIAQAMVKHAELRLWVFQKNDAAIRFYEARGFHLVEQTDGSCNAEKEPDALYRWRREP